MIVRGNFFRFLNLVKQRAMAGTMIIHLTINSKRSRRISCNCSFSLMNIVLRMKLSTKAFRYVFSRTRITRAETKEPFYEDGLRGFLSFDNDGKFDFRICLPDM